MPAAPLAPLFGELGAATPGAWFDAACERWQELLVDHANCEKKAASTALSFIFSYAADAELTDRLSRLAREELRHFEQVQKLMRELHVPWTKLSPSRYADGLRRAVSTAAARPDGHRSPHRSQILRAIRRPGAAFGRSDGGVLRRPRSIGGKAQCPVSQAGRTARAKPGARLQWNLCQVRRH